MFLLFLCLTGVVGADLGFSVLAPNWQNPIIPLQQGTQITPLCDPRLNIPCLQQWTHLAQPFAVTPIGSMLPSMEYYVPAGVFDTQLPINTRMSEDWTLYTPSFPGRYSRSRSRARTRYYTSKSRPGRIREVTTNARGRRTKVKEGESVFVPIEAVKVEGSKDEKTSGPLNRARKTSKPKKSDDTLKKTDVGSDKEQPQPTATEVQAESVSSSDSAVSPRDRDIVVEEKEEKEEERSVTPQQSASKPVKRTEPQEEVSLGSSDEDVLSSGSGADPLSDSSGSAGTSDVGTDTTSQAPAKPSATPTFVQRVPDVRLTEDVLAVSAQLSSSNKPSSGCVKIDKKAKSNNPEDSDFCETCNPHFQKIKDNETVLKNLGKLLRAVLSGATKDSSEKTRKDGSKRVHIPDLEEGSVTGSWTRLFYKVSDGGTICSPDVALEQIVGKKGKFNTTCKPLKFEEFYPDAYCQSCQKNMPPEVMFSMMTIESAGDCKAHNKEDENSMGLFQVNSDAHTCNDGTVQDNKTCLLKPSNSLNCGADILNTYYDAVNPERKESSSCPQWTNLDPTERDRWRRAVAGYNSNPGWVDRAVQSVEGDATPVAAVDIAALNVSNKSDDKTIIDAAKAEAKVEAGAVAVIDTDRAGVKKVFFYKSEGRDFSKGTSDLDGSVSDGRFAGRARKSTVAWEELRVYFLMEKLLQEDKTGYKTGRKTVSTLSNLAHVEAVLGREAKGSPPGIVEFWSQYVKEHPPKAGECTASNSKKICTSK